MLIKQLINIIKYLCNFYILQYLYTIKMLNNYKHLKVV